MFRCIPRLVILGLLSVVIYTGIAWLSHAFVYGQDHLERPIGIYVLLYGAAFVVYAVAVWSVARPSAASAPLLFIGVFAVLFRLVLLFSEPIQEDDFYRYLWDGKLVASGLNPYRFSPQQVSGARLPTSAEPGPIQAYREIIETDEGFAHILSRVNHPQMPTIYPPLAQAVFGLNAAVAPRSLLALRTSFLVFDLGIVAGVVGLLRRLGRPTGWVLIYAWSPLVIKETINSPHFDGLPTFLLVLAVLALINRRSWLGHVGLGLATLGKLFPALLVPLCTYYTWQQRGVWHACGGLILVCVVVACGYLPFITAGSVLWQGSVAFAEGWQTNSVVFPVVSRLVADRWLANGVSAVGGLIAVAVGIRWTAAGDAEALLRGCFLVIGALLLLSPVGNPWYYVWVMPFVCLFPRASWLLLSGLLGLYYFNFYFLYRGQADSFGWIIWLEYLPFYALLTWEAWRMRNERPSIFELAAGLHPRIQNNV